MLTLHAKHFGFLSSNGSLDWCSADDARHMLHISEHIFSASDRNSDWRAYLFERCEGRVALDRGFVPRPLPKRKKRFKLW